MRLIELERRLSYEGWRLDHIAGGHRHYRNNRGQRLVIAAHGRNKEIDKPQLDHIKRDVVRLRAEYNARRQPHHNGAKE